MIYMITDKLCCRISEMEKRFTYNINNIDFREIPANLRNRSSFRV